MNPKLKELQDKVFFLTREVESLRNKLKEALMFRRNNSKLRKTIKAIALWWAKFKRHLNS